MTKNVFRDGELRVTFSMLVPETGLRRADLKQQLGAIGAKGPVRIKHTPAPAPEMVTVPVKDNEVLTLIKLSTMMAIPPFGRDDLETYLQTVGEGGSDLSRIWSPLAERDWWEDEQNIHNYDWAEERLSEAHKDARDDVNELTSRDITVEQALGKLQNHYWFSGVRRSKEIPGLHTQLLTGWQSLPHKTKTKAGARINYDAFLEFLDQAFSVDGKGGYMNQGPKTYRLMKDFALHWWKINADRMFDEQGLKFKSEQLYRDAYHASHAAKL